MNKIISYATPEYKDLQIRLNQSANNLGIGYTSYYPDMIDDAFYLICKDILRNKRGAGYWLWKPYIIIDSLNKADYVFYCDADVQVLKDPFCLFKDRDIVLSSNYPGIINRNWVKKECYELIDKDVVDLPHLEACVIGFKNTRENYELINEWFVWCCKERYITDTLNEPQLDGFKDHRHDQALLTILKYKYDLPTYPISTIKQYFDIGK
jgi:hypothetical protein